MKKGLMVAIAAVLTALGPTALADQVTFGGSGGSATFCAPTGGGPITVAGSFSNLANCTGPTAVTLTGTATFEHPNGTPFSTGNYSVTFPVPPLVLTGNPPAPFSTFSPNGVTSAFSLTNFPPAGTGGLTGTITWTIGKDNTPTPDLDGTLTILTNTGTGFFLTDFPVGSTTTIDFTWSAVSPTWDQMATNGGNATSTLQTGSLAGVPDGGATVMLLGGVLVGLAAVRRRLGV